MIDLRHTSRRTLRLKTIIEKSYVAALGATALLIGASTSTVAQSFVVPSGQTEGPKTMANDGDTGLVETGGTISATGAGVHGVEMQNDNQTLTNEGLIEADGNNAFGVNSTGAGATITNSGTIKVDGNFAAGIYAAGADVVIDNKGQILTDGHTSFGIQTDTSAVRASVTNSGTISTKIENAHAVQVLGASSTVVNRGSINTEGQADAIQIGGASSSVQNIGSIRTITGGARGIQILEPAASSTVINSGTIRTTGRGADGILSSAANSTIHNSGTIVVEGINSIGISSAATAGLTPDFRVFNSGHVKSSNIAIRISGDNSSLTLQPGSVIEGLIDFRDMNSNQTLTVENGLSINNTHRTSQPATINSNGAPYATSGLRVAVVDPTNLSTQDEQLADLTGGISSALENRLSSVRNGAAGSVTTSGPFDGGAAALEPGHPFWIEGFGSYRQQDASAPAVETDQWVGGFVIGADGLLRDDLRAGFFGGAAWGGVEADFNSQETDSQSFFVGSYASLLRAGLIFDLSLTAGYSDFEQERSVANNLVAGGLETATADFSGWFVSPELTVTKPTVFLGRRLEGSLALRYAGLFLDGYTESGTTAPLTVDDRDVHIGIARLQLAAPYETVFSDGSAFRYRIKAGIEARTNFGGDTIDGALLGQNISFNPGGDENTLGGYVGLSGEYDTGGGLVLTAGAEGLIDTSGSFQVSGRAGVAFRF